MLSIQIKSPYNHDCHLRSIGSDPSSNSQVHTQFRSIKAQAITCIFALDLTIHKISITCTHTTTLIFIPLYSLAFIQYHRSKPYSSRWFIQTGSKHPLLGSIPQGNTMVRTLDIQNTMVWKMYVPMLIHTCLCT